MGIGLGTVPGSLGRLGSQSRKGASRAAKDDAPGESVGLCLARPRHENGLLAGKDHCILYEVLYWNY